MAKVVLLETALWASPTALKRTSFWQTIFMDTTSCFSKMFGVGTGFLPVLLVEY
jgi:hypothetical protein